MLAHLAQERRGEPLLPEKVEHRGGPVVARRVVGRAREPVATLAIRHLPRSLPLRERSELAIPAGHDRPKFGVPRDTEEAISLAQLAVLVPAAHHEGIVESLAGKR